MKRRIVDVQILATESVLASAPLCLVIYCSKMVFPSFLTFCQFFFPSFLLHSEWVFSNLFISPSFSSSTHLSHRKREKDREYASRKLLSHTVQEGDSMSKIKQCSLAPQWMHSLRLSLSRRSLPPSSFTKSLSPFHSSTSSFALFALSVGCDVRLPSLNSPATL